MRIQTTLIILALAFSATAWSREVVRLAIGEWPPYTSKLDPKGKMLEKVVTAAFQLEDVDVHYDYFPWKRSYVLALNGQYDGTFPWNKLPARELDFHVNSISMMKDEGVYFFIKGRPFDWDTLEDLKKYRVGVTLGYKQEEEYRNAGINADVTDTEELNFKKLLAGRIDVYQTSKTVGYVMIHKLFSPEDAAKFTTHPKVVNQDDYYILFSRQTANGKNLAEKFDSGLSKLKSTGAYQKILADALAGK